MRLVFVERQLQRTHDPAHGWFDLSNNDGTLQSIVDRLTHFVIENGELAEDLWCVDGTILRAHRCAAGGGKKGIPKNQIIMLQDVLAGGGRQNFTS